MSSTDGDRILVRAVVYWFPHNDHIDAAGRLWLPQLTGDELRALMPRIAADAVPGVSDYTTRQHGGCTLLDVQPDDGHSTVQGMEQLLRQIGAVLGYELTVTDERYQAPPPLLVLAPLDVAEMLGIVSPAPYPSPTV